MADEKMRGESRQETGKKDGQEGEGGQMGGKWRINKRQRTANRSGKSVLKMMKKLMLSLFAGVCAIENTSSDIQFVIKLYRWRFSTAWRRRLRAFTRLARGVPTLRRMWQ